MDATYTQEYEQFELRHWWFVVRRKIIHRAMSQYADELRRDGRWLDVGCGTGVLLESYPEIETSRKTGLELDAQLVARAQLKGLDVRQVDANWDFTEYGSFNLITLTDVLEHVEHEREAIDAVRAVLCDDGVLLVTVPALMSLWSGHDVVNRHYRRYTKRTLLALFSPDEWDVLKVSYFSSLLLPMIWLARRWKNFRGQRSPSDHATHDFQFSRLDPLLETVFRCEVPWLKHAAFLLGSSILLVLRKKPKPSAGHRT